MAGPALWGLNRRQFRPENAHLGLPYRKKPTGAAGKDNSGSQNQKNLQIRGFLAFGLSASGNSNDGAWPEVSVSERLSTNLDARQLKKGGRCRFGYKGFVCTDGEGFPGTSPCPGIAAGSTGWCRGPGSWGGGAQRLNGHEGDGH